MYNILHPAIIGLLACSAGAHPGSSVQKRLADNTLPQPPAPEPITITKIPLPPVVPNSNNGSCTASINPHGTGCIGRSTGLQAGNFLPDGEHILATVKFTGAPAAPNRASMYTGQQVIVIKADGSNFSNGDSWKCLSCGVPANQSVGLSGAPEYSYPQAFADGKRALAGTYIIDCGRYNLTDDKCTPAQTSIHLIRFENSPEGSGPGASIRELRLHPDNVHLGFNSFDYTSGALGQYAYIGRLSFNPSPTTGTPLGPRYDLHNVSRLYNPDGAAPLYANGSELFLNSSAITVGELRGFSGTGREVTYIGYSAESCNIDVFAADLYTGKVRRLTSHPGYVDPVHISPDDNSIVIMDTRGTNRTEFLDGLRNVPPIVDQITTTICSSERNNGVRRFFQPWLLDRHGDRGDYYGQEINGASKGIQGSGAIDDPVWNGQADPWFSPDGTKIVYWQAQAVSPACGGANPLPCYNSTEPGGRTERVLIAHLTSRRPLKKAPVAVLPDDIPWATPYVPGKSVPARPFPAGNFTLKGQSSGFAAVEIIYDAANAAPQTVKVDYHNYSDDGVGVFKGYQNITRTTQNLTIDHLDWYTDLRYTGRNGNGSQVSGPGGFHVSIDALVNYFEANGTLVTVVNGTKYTQPANGQ